ncbi:fibronectin type III domain-containing protein [Sphingomonas koreensis]|uniref:fibronectin type III domain-containing protein n=1 Tax=Sphingomonas koreensis TaxID=93064 RepID=UPI000F7E8093|nr:fibronectin type III domain-containing protein [Sphingomonas koreensis]RSU21197.1 hypothetical protein CA224_06750 [Sphingomonas koreensis]RSU32238.1 hypothetical protein CA225_02735 [Sphingomonas koreensis]RSU35732.1 hypothetical protein BRX39_08905 [Sphingomonas koreensis]RSU49903.1 hypothetical protein CA221_12525 [Sphingomonas koreensis]RSU83500.1 fibronectin type III domain-containing protein [Sphingomonas koreensis]
MPQAIAAFFVKLGLSAFAAAIASAVVQIAITVGINALIRAVFGSRSAKPSDGQQNINEAIGSRRRHYGIVHTGGQRTFLESAGGRLGINVTLGTGKEGPIIQHRINDKPVTVVGGTVTEPSFHNAIHIYTRSGEDSQTAISELTAHFPQWTVNHRQRGCAHAAIICDPVKQEHFSEVFNGQMPTYTQVRHGVSVYDPRKDSTAIIFDDGNGFTVNGTGPHRLNDPGTWEWSDNGPLVTADYFAHADGYGGGYENVNWTNIAQEAEHAAEIVTTVTGETIARWRLWASYSLASTERRQVMADLLKACDGFIWQDAEGRFNLMVGRFVEPSVIITDDHILGMTATLGPQAQQRVNAVKVLYTEASLGYREQESATFADPDAIDDPNTDPQAVEAFYAPHHNQAVRVGKLVLARLGDRWHITALLNLHGLNLLGERFARLESAQLGVATYFMVSGLRLNLADCTVEATLDEVKPEDWEFDAETEEGSPPNTPDAPAPPPPLAAPTGLALSAVQIALGDANGVSIAASWGDPGRPDLTFESQYRPSAGGDWVPMVVDNDARTSRTGPVDSGTEYEVRVRALTITGRASAWASDFITPTADTASLAAPTDLDAEDGIGESVVTFRMPTGATLAYARLYHSTSNDFGTAIQVGGNIVAGLGQVVEVTATGLSVGTSYFWARAFNSGGTPSPLAGPVSATIS